MQDDLNKEQQPAEPLQDKSEPVKEPAASGAAETDSVSSADVKQPEPQASPVEQPNVQQNYLTAPAIRRVHRHSSRLTPSKTAITVQIPIMCITAHRKSRKSKLKRIPSTKRTDFAFSSVRLPLAWFLRSSGFPWRLSKGTTSRKRQRATTPLLSISQSLRQRPAPAQTAN